jgi:hypothetical protein
MHVDDDQLIGGLGLWHNSNNHAWVQVALNDPFCVRSDPMVVGIDLQNDLPRDMCKKFDLLFSSLSFEL